MSKRRITEIDFVRGISILCVHVGHCGIELGAVTKLWQTFFMSAFFLFSGFLSRQKPFRKILRSTLLLYYLWTVGLHALMAISDLRHGVFSLSAWLSALPPILLGINQPNESAQLWFLVALFTTQTLWLVLCRLLPSMKARLTAAAALMAVGIALNAAGIRAMPFRLATALIMLPVFAFGKVLSEGGISTPPEKFWTPAWAFPGSPCCPRSGALALS